VLSTKLVLAFLIWIILGLRSDSKIAECRIAFFVTVHVIKETVARDFIPTVLFHQSTPHWALIHWLRPFRIWLRIRRYNRFESRQNRFQRGHCPR
jgi:hypothetical protein